MKKKIGLDKFCNYLSKLNLDFTDFILEDWESQEQGNVKLNGLTEAEWIRLYFNFVKKKLLNAISKISDTLKFNYPF